MLNKAINAALADPHMKARLADLGGAPMAGTPEDFGKIIVDETEKWGKVVNSPAPTWIRSRIGRGDNQAPRRSPDPGSFRMSRKRPEDLRSHRWLGVNDLRSFGHRSRLRQIGYDADDWARQAGDRHHQHLERDQPLPRAICARAPRT